MIHVFIIFAAISVAQVKPKTIQAEIKEYFDSDTVKSFKTAWDKFTISYGNALGFALKEDYGHKTMNVYINRFHKPLLVASGYYHTDNQVHLVFRDMMLESLPHLYDVEMSAPLASNVVQVEASVAKIIVHTSYMLYRNQSDIIYSPADQDSYKNSPFRFQQVANSADLAISLEGCTFSGTIVAFLGGTSVNLGHSELKLKDCQYSLEIYKLGTGSPPVIANYLLNGEKGLNLEILLSRTLLEELVPKLQGAFFSEVNTSALFTTNLPKYRETQEVLFENTKNYLDEVIRDMNKRSMEKNMGTIELGEFAIAWDEPFTELPSAKSFIISKLTLLGLDTLYSSHSGGPIRLTDIEIVEQLRFSTLQVVGQLSIEGLKDGSEFAVEISDLIVDVNIDLELKIKFEVLGWRFLEFSCPDLEFLPTEALVVGYLLNEVPKHIKSHLHSVYGGGKISSISKSEKLVFENYGDQYVDEQPGDGHFNMNSKEQQGNQDQVNLKHIDVKSDEDKDMVKLSDDVNFKLHYAHGEPHAVSDGPVQLNHVQAIHHDEDDNANTAQLADHRLVPLNDEIHHNEGDKIVHLNNNVKLKYVNVVPHQALEDGEIKLHDVEVKPHVQTGIQQLNGEDGSKIVQLHHVDVEHYKYPPGTVQVHNVHVVHDDTISGEDKNKKSPKKAARKKLRRNRRIFTKPLHEATKQIKYAHKERRANKLNASTRKRLHMSDNEVRSN